MEKQLFKQGRKVDIYCLYEGDRCLLLEFLSDLAKRDERAYKKALALIEKTADHGPPHNTEKYRKLHGGVKLWELKPHPVRIMLFYDEANNMILTHGFLKKRDKTPKNQIERGLRIRKEYFAELREL